MCGRGRENEQEEFRLRGKASLLLGRFDRGILQARRDFGERAVGLLFELRSRRWRG